LNLSIKFRRITASYLSGRNGLAIELDVLRQTIIAIEKGKYDPSLSLAFKAAKLFDMAIEAIVQAPETA
jgi:putative transcriptional regulator